MFNIGTKAKKVAGSLFGKDKKLAEEHALLSQVRRLADVASNPLMIIDRDFKIIYVNDASKALVRKVRDRLPARAQNLDPDNMTGVCADIFHKEPSHIRRLLDDPWRLPHKADVKAGGHTFELCINAIHGADGAYVGNVFEWADVTEIRDIISRAKAEEEASQRLRAIIEFTLDGHVITANPNYLNIMGFTLNEIVGQHHSMLVDPEIRGSEAYRSFVQKFERAEFFRGEGKRIAKGGREVWIAASYNPVFDHNGKPVKIVAHVTDITEQKKANLNYEAQLAAINKNQVVIEFSLDGKVLHANENFMMATGYTLEEIRGRDHDIFLDQDLRGSNEVRAIWDRLRSGEAYSGQFRRIGKNGRVFWLQASYNPVLDFNGKPMKIVEFATDITQQKITEAQLVKTVADIRSVIQAAKESDLTRRVPIDGKNGDLHELSLGINGFLDEMSAIIGSILNASSTIAAATAEIATGTNDLSQRTEQQASSLEETAASMEEMASTIRNNADNAGRANQFSVNARTLASDGGSVVAKAVTAMSAIEHSSNKISDIISVIDEIAFQTNLLALNAAVEAARAGDAGKGFAVVASEVRSLAQRSSVAAKDIKALIVESGRQVKDGVKLVADTGTALQEIVASINGAADIVSEIAAATKEQSTGVSEINKAVAQMDQMTQQNAALVEEAAASSRTLQSEAEAMFERLSAFRLENEAGAPAATRSVAPKTVQQKRSPRAGEPRLNGAHRANGESAQYCGTRSKAANEENDWHEF
ncbi:diguanylate cyclase [Rhodomicrobium udaipurense JA643]|uniref:PAS domain S-box protein n=1 Tax=Rhodomicrobium udaipurense TaxID=1202716 RepID=A0A8I1GBS5_9HYPH|nr:methyl-accepting chemotaxis protein [Rhodomicrobium udaipurense]KAI93808.1 diguanylate cyclase [Rhodomicrobium udaipurense JA643]MBJ7541979.1 PAS domain S-box protein [Rhodomicrobium udaipurense]